MIWIKEGPTRSLPGLSSLFVTFDFKQQIVDELKLFPTFIFNPNHKDWELPTSNLSQLLDTLTNIDDIHLSLIETKPQDFVEYPLCDYKIKPFKHQIDAIQ